MIGNPLKPSFKHSRRFKPLPIYGNSQIVNNAPGPKPKGMPNPEPAYNGLGSRVGYIGGLSGNIYSRAPKQFLVGCVMFASKGL